MSYDDEDDVLGPPMAYPYILNADHDPVSYSAADPRSILHHYAEVLMGYLTGDDTVRRAQERVEGTLAYFGILGRRYDEPNISEMDRLQVEAYGWIEQLRQAVIRHQANLYRSRRGWATALAKVNAKIVVGGDQVPANPKLVALATECWPRYGHHVGTPDPAGAEQGVCSACIDRPEDQ